MSKKLSILIADDHPLYREGIRTVVQKEPLVETIIEEGNGLRALQCIETLLPAVAILDIDMPGMNGLAIAEEVQKKNLPTKLIILTMYDDEDLFNRAMDVGVMGYVLKDGAVSEIRSCISSVIEDIPFVSPSLSKMLIRRSGKQLKSDEQLGISALTPSERKILRFVGDGFTTKEIADKLSLSPKTIENHRANICDKLQIHGTNALFRFAMENKRFL
ncbi:MAG: response regulator transcription factor [Bacteroidetes bacterium]|nr:MAG: response regulator transcription factor [Bacteroidota bacterium]